MVDAAQDIDYEEQLARIRRSQEETRKFVAEQHKLMAEQQKLLSEGAKFERERILYPIALSIGVMGAIIGSIATLLVHFLH